MANEEQNNLIGRFFGLLEDIQKNAHNLSKDVDEKDQREETKADMSQLVTSFADLRKLMANLEQSDINQLQEEMRQLMRGEESFAEYNQDVTKILAQVHQRMQNHAPTEEKIKSNLPEQAKNQSAGSLFEGWGSLLSKANEWIEKNSTQKSRK